MVSAFFKGLLLAIGLVMPLGMQNTFIINQAANQTRYLKIMPVVITSIIADAILIIGAILGVGILLEITWLRPLITFIGIIFLFYMGYVMFKTKAQELQDNATKITVMQQIAFTFALALLNPHAILDTFVVIGSVSAGYEGTEKHAFAMGCIFMDCMWFTFLSICGYSVRKLDSGVKIVTMLNKISALIMWYIAFDLTGDLIKLFQGGNI